MPKVLTIREIRDATADYRDIPSFLRQQREEHGYLIVHYPHPDDVGLPPNGFRGGYSPVLYADEVWFIRQIGAAMCVKHRYQPTPFERLF